MTHCHCGASIGNIKVSDLAFVNEAVILAEPLEVLAMTLVALSDDAKPCRLLGQEQGKVFRGLLEDTVQSVHA